MINAAKLQKKCSLIAGVLFITSCTHAPPPDDDLANIRIFEKELAELCSQGIGGYRYPEVEFGLSESGNGAIESLRIRNGNINQLPNSIFQFHNLQRLVLSQTRLTTLPDLRRLTRLTNLHIDNAELKGPVHLKNLPASLVTLELIGDEITDLQVDDSLPNLTILSLTHNRMNGRINSTFRKLPHLSSLDISYGCCLSRTQQLEEINAAKKVLGKEDVDVTDKTGFID